MKGGTEEVEISCLICLQRERRLRMANKFDTKKVITEKYFLLCSRSINRK